MLASNRKQPPSTGPRSEECILTLFAVPKPFTGQTGLIQRNAIGSWIRQPSRPAILLVGEEEGVAEAAEVFGVQAIPDVARNEFGTPLINDIFAAAERASRTPLLMYVNADIILTDDVAEVLSHVPFDDFLLTGRRWDLDVREGLDFADGWQRRVKQAVTTQGKLHAPTGLDYFVFPRGSWERLPPFALGRTVWDNYLVYSARARRVPVIDATRVFTAVHQNHTYDHLSKHIELEQRGGEIFWKGTEADINMKLAGGPVSLLDVRDATWIFDRNGLHRALGRKYLRRRINFQLDHYIPRIARALRRLKSFQRST